MMPPLLLPLRFIPARAGNRVPALASLRIRPVHPRACGEQSADITSNIMSGGSSPRVRGTVGPCLGFNLCGRFIPARAGNSGSVDMVLSDIPVHPRACGEQPRGGGMFKRSDGSSPRVRGTVLLRDCRMGVCRFIPARAGNSALSGLSVTLITVHPRACGEQSTAWDISTASYGSSPRVRGTVAFAMSSVGMPRFIPARAGNSLSVDL